MDAAIKKYLSTQPADWRDVMSDIHSIIVEGDKTVAAGIEPMMGKDMILYKDRRMMKYGLAGVKKYMTLHVLPMYMHETLFDKYKALLPDASFQKGCINFESADAMPLDVVKKLIAACSKIDLVKIREEQLKARKKK